MIFASKYHGYGNDFLVVAGDQLPDERYSELARAICDPHFGIGADGCVFVEPPSGQPLGIRIFNQDGTEAEMSGNGARCAAAFIHHRRISSDRELELQTLAGPRLYVLQSTEDLRWTYRSSMGVPRFAPPEIPFRPASDVSEVIGYSLSLEGETVLINALNVGNPQCVVFVEAGFSDSEFHQYGSGLAAHDSFPDSTNVSFVRTINRNQLQIRIWERGVGPTHSSGTGSCGAGVMGIHLGRVDSPVEVTTASGTQIVQWTEGEEIFLTGGAEFIGDIHYNWQNQ